MTSKPVALLLADLGVTKTQGASMAVTLHTEREGEFVRRGNK